MVEWDDIEVTTFMDYLLLLTLPWSLVNNSLLFVFVLQAGLDFSVHACCLGVMLKPYEKKFLGTMLVFAMPCALKEESQLQQQQRFFTVLILRPQFSSARHCYLPGGCVQSTQVCLGSRCKRNIISR